MADKDLIIRIKSEYKDLGIKDLKTELKDVQTQMDSLRKSGQQSTESFDVLKTKAGVLTGEIRSLNREYKGLDGTAKMSNAEMQNYGKNLAAISIGAIEVSKALVAVIKSMKDMVMHGAEFGVLKDNFDKIAGSTELANDQLQLMRKASGGQLDNKDLIEYTAKMRLLGFGVEDTSKLLYLVKERSEQVGVSFGKGEKALQTFILTGKGRALKELGINVNEVTTEIDKLTLATGKNSDELSDEEKQAIRLQAVFNVTKVSMEDVSKATMNAADKLKSLETASANAKLEIGNLIAKGTVSLIESLGLTSNAAITTTGYISAIGGTATSILPALAALKLALGTAFAGVATVVGTVSVGIVNLGAHILNAYNLVKLFIDMVTGDKWDEVRNSWFGKFIGMDSTNHEQNKKNENSWLDNYKNGFNFVKGALTKDLLNQPEVHPTRDDYKEYDKKTGKGSKVKNIEEETKAIDIQSVALKRLSAEWDKLAKSTIFSEPQGFTANSKKLPADQNTKAIMADIIKVSFREVVDNAAEVFGKIKDSLSNLTTFLNIGANTFIGTMIKGFDRALSAVQAIASILEAIKSAKSFIDIISGVVTGGASLAGGASSGIRGIPSIGGMRPQMNLSHLQMRPNITVVVQSEVESTKAIKFFNTNFNKYQNYLKSNTFS